MIIWRAKNIKRSTQKYQRDDAREGGYKHSLVLTPAPHPICNTTSTFNTLLTSNNTESCISHVRFTKHQWKKELMERIQLQTYDLHGTNSSRFFPSPCPLPMSVPMYLTICDTDKDRLWHTKFSNKRGHGTPGVHLNSITLNKKESTKKIHI